MTISGPPAGRREQLRQPRLAEVVAGVLRERIVNGELGDGDLLPKQDELMEEYRISRPYPARGPADSRGRGPADRPPRQRRAARRCGCRPPIPRPTRSGSLLQSRRTTFEDLATAIKHIEPVAASLCAGRPDRDRSVIPALRANLDDTEAATSDGPQFTALARQFHELLVSCCGNETLIVAVGALESLWSEQERQWAVRAASEGCLPGGALPARCPGRARRPGGRDRARRRRGRRTARREPPPAFPALRSRRVPGPGRAGYGPAAGATRSDRDLSPWRPGAPDVTGSRRRRAR